MIKGEFLQRILLVQYAIIMIVYGFEGNLAKALYWAGALIITLAVLAMK